MNKKTQKFMVYVMLIAILVTTLLTGLSMLW
ncbi:stressosome-associated protein Prli42 [Bacillus rhizoplanae]